MISEIISVGDEITLGQTINTNAAEISRYLAQAGIPATWITAVGDDVQRIASAIRHGLTRAELIIMTGGLGPTHDDITHEALSDVFCNGRVEDISQTSQTVINPIGSAAGLLFTDETARLIALPGVPMEMRVMMETQVCPLLRSWYPGHALHMKTLRTTGIRESDLFQQINVNNVEKFASLAFLPGPSGVDMRLTAEGSCQDDVLHAIAQAESMIRKTVNRWIYSTERNGLEGIIATLLTSRNLKIATAESCTGGLIAHKLTSIPGSSNYFDQGAVTYSNHSKIDRLGVPVDLLNQFGAVSAEVATSMAEGIRRIAGTELGLSTTGIAGPGGETPEKPVGLLFTALATPNNVFVKSIISKGDRQFNQIRFAQAALDMVRRWLLGFPVTETTFSSISKPSRKS